MRLARTAGAKNKSTSCRAAALACSLFAALFVAAPLFGQGVEPPPRQDTVSPTGVSFKSGAFTHNVRDFAIGAGEFPQGLTLDRSYASRLDTAFSWGFGSQGWSHNFVATITSQIIPNEFIQPPPGQERWLYSVTYGNRSVGFVGGSTNPTGGFVGTYEPANRGGQSLVFTGTEQSGTFTFTDSDGTVLEFSPRTEGVRVTSWTAPDGTRLSFTYVGVDLRSIISSRGYALLFEDQATGRLTRACVVNMAHTYVTATSACPAGAQSVSYAYTVSPNYQSRQNLTGVTDAAGQTSVYAYTGSAAADHLQCIRLPGQASCLISNTYNVCHRDPTLDEDPPGLRYMDQVVSQVTATGETYSYSFPPDPECPDPSPLVTDTTMTVSGTATTQVTTNGAGLPTSVTDPINRTTTISYYPPHRLITEAADPRLVTHPEENQVEFGYDARGNLISRRMIAKTGSALADIVVTADFADACASRKTCNRPDYVIDARAARTDFTYSPDHGGVLTETGPAVNGVRPQTRYSYAQRYAWIRNSSGGYTQAATPIWVPTATSLCRNSAATGISSAPCATAGDEVRTTFDYGPNSGPNNLWLRGQVVDAGGLSLRTCYSYDANGNRISETTPRAGLAACP